MSYFFTSEAVSEGHPDKICDQISDHILDAVLLQDPYARVAIEALVKNGLVILAGEMDTHAWVDTEKITRETIANIGYNHHSLGFDSQTCALLSAIGRQSPDIAQSVGSSNSVHLGAGDQGMMFGYACVETDQLMPAPIVYAQAIVKRLSDARKKKHVNWLRPDSKAQVTFEYRDGKPYRIDNIVVSTQHQDNIEQKEIASFVIDGIIKPSVPESFLSQTTYRINPSGRFVIGGPVGDCGLTGRKIIVDTYGGMARHGGGAFSGKDPSKVDRSGAYMARYVAKNLVASGLCGRCEVAISFAIGVDQPTSINIETFSSSLFKHDTLEKIVRQCFDFSPHGILNALDLCHQKYAPTATYGHFGRLDKGSFSWEMVDRVEQIQEMAKAYEPAVYGKQADIIHHSQQKMETDYNFA